MKMHVYVLTVYSGSNVERITLDFFIVAVTSVGNALYLGF